MGKGIVKFAGLILLHALVYGLAVVVLGAPPTIAVAVLGTTLIWISVVDAVRFEIPDSAVLVLIVSGVVFAFSSDQGADWPDLLLGATVWTALFWRAAQVFRKLRGFDGLGFGDVKLVAGLGAHLGFSAMIQVVLAAAIGGILFLLAAKVTRGAGVDSAVAFGPFLCLSAWVIWLAMGAT